MLFLAAYDDKILHWRLEEICTNKINDDIL